MKHGCQCPICREVCALLAAAEGVLRRRLTVERREDHQEPYRATLAALQAILEPKEQTRG